MSDGGEVPFAVVASNELVGRLGTHVVCNSCGKLHVIINSDSRTTRPDGSVVETKGFMQSYKCGDKSYMAGMQGRAMPGVETVTPHMQWIPVIDANGKADVPEHEFAVLVYLRLHEHSSDPCDKVMGSFHFIGHYAKDMKVWLVNGQRTPRVTHWMELPEAPKE